MNPFRQMVAQAVLEGQISEQHLTLKEIEELEQQALEAAMEKEMEKSKNLVKYWKKKMIKMKKKSRRPWKKKCFTTELLN